MMMIIFHYTAQTQPELCWVCSERVQVHGICDLFLSIKILYQFNVVFVLLIGDHLKLEMPNADQMELNKRKNL
jgi:hypothetical protein